MTLHSPVGPRLFADSYRDQSLTPSTFYRSRKTRAVLASVEEPCSNKIEMTARRIETRVLIQNSTPCLLNINIRDGHLATSRRAMPVTESQLEGCIRSRVEGVHYCRAVDVSDGCGAKFEVVVVSDVFKGKPLLQQHRLVNKAIEEEMKSIHALTLKTKTCEQYTTETGSALPELDNDHSACLHHSSGHDHSSEHHDHSSDHSACTHSDHTSGLTDHSHQHHHDHSH